MRCLESAKAQQTSRRVRTAAATATGPRATRRIARQPQNRKQQAADSATPERQASVLKGLQEWAAAELPRYIKPSEECWQPADLLPDPSSAEFFQQLSAIREEALRLPNDVLVVLAGLVVVLSTVPNQQSAWCGTPVLAAETGADELDQQPWAWWRRCSAADRNRHRQLLLSYSYYCGAIDSLAVDITMQYAIGSGSSCCQNLDPYQQLMSSALQARMIRVLVDNLSTVAGYHGAAVLADLAAAIAADAARHELAQVSAVRQIFQRDPQGAVQALASSVQHGITLPGCRMDDGWHAEGNAHNTSKLSALLAAASEANATPQQQQQGLVVPAAANAGSSAGAQCSKLYTDFVAAADAVGVYTVSDTAAAVEQCCGVWQVANISAASESAAAARAYLLSYPQHLRRLSEIQLEGRLRARARDNIRSAAFSWVARRDVPLG